LNENIVLKNLVIVNKLMIDSLQYCGKLVEYIKSIAIEKVSFNEDTTSNEGGNRDPKKDTGLPDEDDDDENVPTTQLCTLSLTMKGKENATAGWAKESSVKNTNSGTKNANLKTECDGRNVLKNITNLTSLALYKHNQKHDIILQSQTRKFNHFNIH
jgi:hypothetical protein